MEYWSCWFRNKGLGYKTVPCQAIFCATKPGKEAERWNHPFVGYSVLRKINQSEWALPMLTVTKPDCTLWLLADLWQLNKRSQRKPFPIPQFQELFHNLKGFQYATSLDLNMGYYHIKVTPKASSYCTVVLPRGKYKNLCLPMGLCNSRNMF